ncbi:MAG: outer membrane protein assembly factor BamA [Lentisphaeria bacterium]
MMQRAVIRVMAAGLFICCFLSSLMVNAAVINKITLQGIPDDLNRSGIEELVYWTIGTKKNDNFDAGVLSNDIEKLYKTSRFDDIQTRVVKNTDSTVEVIYIFRVKELIEKIEFEGNKFYSDKKLYREVKHPVGVIADAQIIAADRKAIEDKYNNSGNHGTVVDSKIIKATKDHGAILCYVIQEKMRHKLEGVAFDGNTAFTTSELADVLMTKRQWWRYVLRFGNYFNSQMLIMDKRNLAKFYEEHGFLDFSVQDITYVYNDDKTWVTPVYKLYEGKQYKVGDVAIAGAVKYTQEELLKDPVLVPGQIFDIKLEKIQSDKIKNHYAPDGYIDFSIYSARKLNREKQTVDVKYQIQEGRPSRIRNIDIVGNEVTQDHVIRRELTLFPGDLGDSRKIDISKQRLKNLDYFNSVEMVTVATDSPDLKDLRIELEEKKTGSLNIGAGFSSADSVIGFCEFTETNYDLAKWNTWPQRGGGQRLRAYIGAGSEVINMSLSLLEPSIHDSDISFNTEFFVNTRYEDEYDDQRIGASFMFGIPLSFQLFGTDHKEYWNLGLGMKLEHVAISNVDTEDLPTGMSADDFGYRLQDEEDDYFANRLILELTRNTLDKYRFPTKGSRVSFNTELVTSALGSYSNYALMSLDGKKFFPLYKDLVLKTQLNFSSAEHISGDDVAIFDRYFGGGYGSIRGFERRDVAPTVEEVNSNSDDDSPCGGSSMMFGTLELIAPVKDYMYCSIFTDFGNVWWDEFGYDVGDLNLTIGVGIQFKKLPIRLDYGFPISTADSEEHLDGSGGQFHFNMQYTY